MKIIIKNSINYIILRTGHCIRLNHSKTKVKDKKSEVVYPKITTKSNSAEVKTYLAHAYRKVHPWKSKEQFVNSIVNQIIYNKDGLIAINKPYGISARPPDPNQIRKYNEPSGIPREVKYTITDALPELARAVNSESLTIIKTPERFTTGVLLLSVNDKITDAVEKSLRMAQTLRIIPRTYWAVTRRIPIHNEGEAKVAMKLVDGIETDRKEVTIVTKWTENERKRNDIKILNIQYKVLCTSTSNVASLLQIKTSTSQWHSIRLFAATVLMSPILGDRVYGSRTQDVMGTFLKVSPFVQAARALPKLDLPLLRLLRLTQGNCMMIPAHIHLQEIFLPSFMKNGNDINITAPLQPEFRWTCHQLYFKKEVYNVNCNVENNVNNTERHSKVDIDTNKEKCSVKQCTDVT